MARKMFTKPSWIQLLRWFDFSQSETGKTIEEPLKELPWIQQRCCSNFARTCSMFHVTWTTFKFNRKQLGTVSAYVMWLWLIALLMWTLKWLSSVEIQYHKGFHLKPKAAINNTEISSLICKTILIFSEHNSQYLLVVRSPTVKFFGE